MLDSTLFNQISFGNSDRAAYSDLNPDDGGQSLYPMSTVLRYLVVQIKSIYVSLPDITISDLFLSRRETESVESAAAPK